MPDFTIQSFWRDRLRVERVPSASLIEGWSFVEEGLPTFKEAPLCLSDELSVGANPYASPVLLVSAPGAVGKSTLARQIAFETGSVYVDLAKSEPVGSNSLVGGLVNSSLFDAWQRHTVGVLIDGLDEARLRVTEEAFESYLRDISRLSRDRPVPTVLFGRTGAIQDAWIILGEDTPVLEIGYYSPATAIDFVEAVLRASRAQHTHSAIERKAIEGILARLREQTETDGDRFAGYAPVLQAVATRVIKEPNASALLALTEAGAQPVTLSGVVSAILERERGKLASLQFSDTKLSERLYTADEQLDHLAARVYGLPQLSVAGLSSNDARIYDTALKTWIAEHPFLSGRPEPSSAVFDAVIAERALKQDRSSGVALDRELIRGSSSANPFLAEFYMSARNGTETTMFLPSEHIGIIYASVRARLSLGDTASLVVEACEEGAEEDVLRTEVEVTLGRRGNIEPKYLRFESDQTGSLRLGSQVEDVEINVPYAKVEFGPGSETLLIAPVTVQCETFSILTEKLIIETAQGRGDAAVFLEAVNFEGALNSVPIVRGNVALSVSSPGVLRHPWSSFASDPSPITEPGIDEALRRLRKFVIAFRSHSKGSLRRYRDKLDHARMTKGSGRSVLKLMLDESIVFIAGNMYVLDPNRLAECTGMTYGDCMAQHFNERAIAFVRRAV